MRVKKTAQITVEESALQEDSLDTDGIGFEDMIEELDE